MKRILGTIIIVALLLSSNLQFITPLAVASDEEGGLVGKADPAKREKVVPFGMEEVAVIPEIGKAVSPEGPFVITANRECTISIVDIASDAVYGPFLAGQLGHASYLYDVAVSPDGNTAIVSNLTLSTIYFIDVSDPTSPSLLGDLYIQMFFPSDIVITADNDYALLTPGTGVTQEVVTVDIATRSTVDTESVNGRAVAVASNGTVVVADTENHILHTFVVDSSGFLTPGSTYNEGLNGPVNVSIAPDNQTVIVCNQFDDTVAIYQISGVGTLTYESTVSGLPGT